MAFVEPKTIAEVIFDVHKKKYVLPAIQREFVWDTEQIEMLFDSLMRDYPINTFLFWNIEKENTSDYQFYEFIRDFHERDQTHNTKADLKGDENITAVLDGQQRLTSLYIALKGSYAYKEPRKRWDNDSAFPKRVLCLNLLAPADDFEKKFDFQFLTEKEIKTADIDNGYFWFPVGEVLNFDPSKPHEVNSYLISHKINKADDDMFMFANQALFKLFDVIHKDKNINFFLEKSPSLDKVLNIFIRANNGGTPLSYSDLLLSIATAQWEHKDAREEIYSFVDEINSIGTGFDFSKDFVLKSCLVLSDFTDIAFKIDNFDKKNMLEIEERWDEISESIRIAISLTANFGFQRDTLTSNNAIIPIAYYINHIKNPSNFLSSSKYKNERETIFDWLSISLLKRVFGGQPDNVLRPLRETIKSAETSFPYDEIISKFKGGTKALQFNEDNIENLLYCKYSQPYTYATLALIYPTLDFSNKFHQDHIFPQTLFKRTNLKKRGIPEEKWDAYLEYFNFVGNIQLLGGVINQEKSGEDFDIWLKREFPDIDKRKGFMKIHYIPDVDLSFDNFIEFFEEREKLLVEAFKKRLPYSI